MKRVFIAFIACIFSYSSSSADETYESRLQQADHIALFTELQYPCHLNVVRGSVDEWRYSNIPDAGNIDIDQMITRARKVMRAELLDYTLRDVYRLCERMELNYRELGWIEKYIGWDDLGRPTD